MRLGTSTTLGTLDPDTWSVVSDVKDMDSDSVYDWGSNGDVIGDVAAEDDRLKLALNSASLYNQSKQSLVLPPSDMQPITTAVSSPS